VQPVPLHLRDKSGQASKRNGHGQGYEYSHEYAEGISGQRFLDQPVTIYQPGTAGAEAAIADRLARWQELRTAARGQS